MSNLWTFVNSFTKVLIPRLWRGLRYGNMVEDRLLTYVKSTAIEGDAASVLAAMDRFNEQQWMMFVECKKREKLEAFLSTVTAPKVCLELGTYCGYSGTVIGRCLPAGSHLITVEKKAKFANIAKQVVAFAGLKEVTILTSKSKDLIRCLRSKHSVDKLDFVFIDHAKGHYLSDLKLLEENQLLRRGTVIVADNTLWPGAPDFLEYVESCPKYETKRAYFNMDMFNVKDAMTTSVYIAHDENENQ